MYVGSPEFQAANAKKFQKHRIKGTIDNVPFTSGNILVNSLTITWQNSDASDAKLGGVFITKLTCTFLNNINISARSWHGRKITVDFGLCVDEDPADVYEYFRLGEFFIAEANRVPEGVAVVAYDAMANFDSPLPYEYLTSGTVYNVLAGLCATCNVGFGMSQSDVEALPNGTQTIGLYTPNDCQTYRDILYWIAVTCGGWATINSAGKLVLKAYPAASVQGDDIDDARRLSDVSFSDFVTNFAAATFENDDGTIQTIGSPSAGVTYNVGFDPFLIFGTTETRDAMRTAVFESIYNIRYMPFKVELMSAPIYELGDLVYLNGGILEGNGYNGIVQRIVFAAGKGFSLEGFGANPNLQTNGAKSETGRAVQQAVINSEIVYKTFENEDVINVSDEEAAQIVNIDFSTTKETQIEIWHEIQLMSYKREESSETIVEAVYYMDGVEQSRKPVEVYEHDGAHLLTLNYTMPVVEVGAHNWQVYLNLLDGEQIVIPSAGILALLKGQGITKGDSWTGVIVLDDEIERAAIGFAARSLSDAVELTLCDVEAVQVADNIARASLAFNARRFAESLTFVLEQPTFDIVDESGEYDITDESGAYDIETE